MTSTKLARPKPGAYSGPYRYGAFGRMIESDLELPSLRPAASASAQLAISRTAVRRWSGGEAVFINLTGEGETVYTLSRGPDGYVWDYPRVGVFEIAADGSAIHWCAADETLPDVRTLLCGPVLGLALQLQGLVGLHGTAVARNGRALGLLAPSGYGKSTLATVLLRRGYDLLTDDILVADVTDAGVFALPSRAQLKLWPESLEELLPDWKPLDTYMSWLEKRVYVPEPATDASGVAARLDVLYVLVQAAEDAEVTIERIQGNQALIALLGLGYQAIQLSREAGLLKTRMEFFQTLAERVSLYSVTCPRSFARLDELADALAAHASSLVEPEA
jgi:hypothetical protein